MRNVFLMLLVFAAAARAGATVSLSVGERAVVISNGVVTAGFDGDGRLRQLWRAGAGELLGHGGGGYFDLTLAGGEKSVSTGGAAFREIRNSSNLVEIAFIKKMTNAEIDLHYVMTADAPGLYVFAVHRHTADMPPQDIAQKRYVLRADPNIFTYAVASKTHHGPMPAPAALGKGAMIHDATYRLDNGAIYTKYDWAEFLGDHWGHGLCGTNAGLWMIFGSGEYFMGGPTKQELTVHQTDTTPVELAMFTGEHFLGSNSIQHVAGDWAMLYGPVFLYANTGNGPQAMFHDASAVAKKLERAWPYTWMKNPLYPLARGTVTGQLKLTGGASTSNATVILASSNTDWQVQWRHPVFSAHAASDGVFRISNVIPGTYTLYSFVPGVLGEFRRDGVVVQPGATNNLDVLGLVPPGFGRTLWQIGNPDRTAGEFKHGGESRHFGLLESYPRDFSNGVNFVIGKSDPRTAWNFAQPVWHNNIKQPFTAWNIDFVCTNAALKSPATLSVAIAGADGSPTLEVILNDRSLGKIQLGDDGSIRRDATLAGRYQLHTVQFNADLICTGNNRMTLRLTNPKPAGALMYDCIRLEAFGD